MPRVPTYENFQTQVTGQPNVQFQAPSGPNPGAVAADQAAQLGQALTRSGDAVGKIALAAADQANQVRVTDAMNKAMAARLKLTYDQKDGYTMRRGAEALDADADGKSLDQSYGDRLKGQIDGIAQGLGNDAQRLAFNQQSNQLMQQFQSGLTQHVAKEYTDHSVSVQQGTTKLAQDQMGLAWGDAEAVDQSRNAIKASVTEEGRLRGWSAKMVEAATVEQLSKGHEAVVSMALQAGKTEYAGIYLKQINAELTDTARLKLTGQVKSVDVLVRGDKAADETWVAMAPKDANDPVRIYDMEKAIRDKYQTEPQLRDAALKSLKDRAATFNAQQSELNAGGINQVYGMIDAGAPLRRVQSSPEWLSLPEVKRHEITKGLESEAATRASRGASDVQRQLATLQRDDKMALLGNAAEYLTVSDPDTLRQMSRAQVEALRPKFGFEGTQHLLSKFEQVSKSDVKVIEARMDKQDFDQVADALGMKPYAKNSSEDHKRALGTLQFRVEQLINAQQAQLKRQLTRDEKTQLMTTEMSKKVAVGGWFRSTDVPVIQLTPDQAGKVEIPASEKAKVAEALRTMYAQSPRNPAFAPTEENMRRLYLQNKSRAAGLIPNAK